MQKFGFVPFVGNLAVLLLGVGAYGQINNNAPTGINGIINVQAYGAVGDGTTDDTSAINAALNAAAGTGATVLLPPTVANLWKVTSTLTVPPKVVFQGQCGSGRGVGVDPIQGSVLLWMGGPNSVVVSYHDTNRSVFRCMTIQNGNGASGLVGILYDSDDNPTSSFNSFENFYIIGAHQGFVCGLPTNTAVNCANQSLSYTSTSGNTQLNGVSGGFGVVPAGTLVTQGNATTTTVSQVTLPVSQLQVNSLAGFNTSSGSIFVGPLSSYQSLSYTSTSGNTQLNGVSGGFGIVPAGTPVTQGTAKTTTVSQVTLPVNQLKVSSTAGFNTSGLMIVGPIGTPGCTESDLAKIQEFEIWGSGVSTNLDEGIHINSANCLQGSVIYQGHFELEHNAVHVVNTNGDFKLQSLSGGSVPVNDTSAVFLQVDAAVVSSPDLSGIETESSWKYAVHDSACNAYGGSPGSPNWIGNFINQAVLADGCETISSIGNNGGIGQMTAAGTTQVVSINEARWFTGYGQPVTCTGVQASPPAFTGCTGGIGIMPKGTIVQQQPNGPSTAMPAITPLPAATILVGTTSGFDLTKKIYVGVPVLSTWNNGLLSTNYYYGAWWCSGTATLSTGGSVSIPNPCLAGASVIGVAEQTLGLPSALGWSVSGNVLTIKSSNSSDSSVVSWWRLR